mmetsp:Transcript_1406/g.3107  ORF Transcript_1406/g.3107 Transcript_1406/m.3107 type:complete len:149 (-) Transcript_1406:457-903(-)
MCACWILNICICMCVCNFRAERLYDKEEVLGRDVSSVFPTESKADEDSITEAVKEAVGSVKFITEKEVEDIKSRQVDDGRVAADAGSSKPLAQVLSERKQQKDDEFQAQWKTMKQGAHLSLSQLLKADDQSTHFQLKNSLAHQAKTGL